MLLPFLPLSPQRLAKLSSLTTAPFGTLSDLSDRSCVLFALSSRPPDSVFPPPRIAETDECAHLACFRMAEVTVMHSVVIRATGSTAMATFGCWCLSSMMEGLSERCRDSGENYRSTPPGASIFMKCGSKLNLPGLTRRKGRNMEACCVCVAFWRIVKWTKMSGTEYRTPTNSRVAGCNICCSVWRVHFFFSSWWCL